MNVRLAVAVAIVCSQGFVGLSQPAFANLTHKLPQQSAHKADTQVDSQADSLPTETVPIRTVPFTDEEIPEEILRTEIITEARSPLTGEPISAAEYAQLTDELRSPAGGNLVSQDIGYLIYLLQLRRAIKPILPFL